MNSSKHHLVIFTTMHPVGDVRVWRKIATSFIDRGWRITWIGPERTDFPVVQDDGGVSFKLAITPRSRMGRLIAIPRLLRMLASTPNVDAIYCPEPDSALLALPFTKVKGARLIFDIHENYHDSALRRWVPPTAVRPLAAILKFLIAKIAGLADFAIAVNTDIADAYSTRSKRPIILRNLAPTSFGKEPKFSPPARDGLNNFRVFHGKAAEENGTRTLLEAWSLLRDHPEIKLVLIPRLADSKTDLMPTLRQEIENLGISDNVELLPALSHSEMPALLDSMNIGLIAYQRDLGYDSLPNRFFEYMARGLATLTPSYSHYLEEITAATRCGISVDMEDPDQIAQSLVSLSVSPETVQTMGQNGQKAFLSNYSWETEFEAFYKLLVDGPR